MTACPTCGATPCVNPTFCATCRHADASCRRPPRPRPRGTPESIVEAIMYCVRERGRAALHEPKVEAWLSECDSAAKQQIKSRLSKLKGKTNEIRKTGT